MTLFLCRTSIYVVRRTPQRSKFRLALSFDNKFSCFSSQDERNRQAAAVSFIFWCTESGESFHLPRQRLIVELWKASRFLHSWKNVLFRKRKFSLYNEQFWIINGFFLYLSGGIFRIFVHPFIFRQYQKWIGSIGRGPEVNIHVKLFS